MNAMDVIPYEEDLFYIFDRGVQRLPAIVQDQCHRSLLHRQGQEEQRLQTIASWFRHPLRSHRVYEQRADPLQVSREDQAHHLLGRRTATEVHLLL